MSEEHPLVSVVIATYNRPAYLRSAIASVSRGSYQNFEIVVTDDAGPKENREVAESFQDPRVRYRRNKMRLGGTGNHREAIKVVAGEYVGLLNDDDEWEPRCLELLVPVLRNHPEVVIAFGDHHVIHANGVIDAAATEESTMRWKRDRLSAGSHQPFYEIALLDQSIPMVAALVRKNAIDWDDSPLEVGSLYDFWVTYLACRNGGAAWYCPERIARYRVHSMNDSVVGGQRTTKSSIYVYSRMVRDPQLAELRPKLQQRLARAQLSYGIILLEHGRAKEARKYLAPALLRGQRARAAIALGVSYLPKLFAPAVIGRLRGARHLR